MSTPESPVESIFFAALAKESPEDRAAYLDEDCGDQEVRQRVDQLLEAHLKMGSFLEGDTPRPALTANEPPLAEAPGTVIGPYKLLEQIGEGGFGVVFMAEQTEPVRRKVAQGGGYLQRLAPAAFAQGRGLRKGGKEAKGPDRFTTRPQRRWSVPLNARRNCDLAMQPIQPVHIPPVQASRFTRGRQPEQEGLSRLPC